MRGSSAIGNDLVSGVGSGVRAGSASVSVRRRRGKGGDGPGPPEGNGPRRAAIGTAELEHREAKVNGVRLHYVVADGREALGRGDVD
ncbi:MAG: hypothetical protein ACOC83_07970, partial [Gemmatimonadota bacterium]